MAGKISKLSPVLLILLLRGGGLLFADKAPVTIEAAEGLEREKKYDQAMVIYEEWLKGNTADDRFASVLLRCGELKKDPLAAAELYVLHLDRLNAGPERMRITRQIAQLFFLTGHYDKALIHFEQAYARLEDIAPDDPWPARIPAVYIACGEIDKSYEWIKRINPAVRGGASRAELNYALLEIYLTRGELSYAEKACAMLASQFKDSVAYPKAVLRMYLHYFSQNQRETASSYFAVLEKEFPLSLEYRAAFEINTSARTAPSRVTPLLDPHEIIGNADFSEAEVKAEGKEKSQSLPRQEEVALETASETSSSKIDRFKIQVGSYTMRENAFYMMRDLEKLNFPVEMVETRIAEKTYYRVFVGKGLDAGDAQNLLARLQDAGINGYLFLSE